MPDVLSGFRELEQLHTSRRSLERLAHKGQDAVDLFRLIAATEYGVVAQLVLFAGEKEAVVGLVGPVHRGHEAHVRTETFAQLFGTGSKWLMVQDLLDALQKTKTEQDKAVYERMRQMKAEQEQELQKKNAAKR